MTRHTRHTPEPTQAEADEANAIVALLSAKVNPALSELHEAIIKATAPEEMPRAAKEAGETHMQYMQDLMEAAGQFISPIKFCKDVCMNPQIERPHADRMRDARKYLSKVADGSVFRDPHRDLSTLTSAAERLPYLAAAIKNVQNACTEVLSTLPPPKQRDGRD